MICFWYFCFLQILIVNGNLFFMFMLVFKLTDNHLAISMKVHNNNNVSNFSLAASNLWNTCLMIK